MGGAVTRLSDEEIRALRAKLEEHAAVSSDPSVPVMLALVAEVQARRQRWQPMETLPEKGQVIVCWAGDDYDTIGRDEYLEVIGYGEPPAKGWMPLPAPPSEDRP